MVPTHLPSPLITNVSEATSLHVFYGYNVASLFFLLVLQSKAFLTPTMPDPNPKPEKICLVTVGATAPFNALVRAALTPQFLSSLSSHDYTGLVIQYGQLSPQHFTELISELSDEDKQGIEIYGFDFGRGASWSNLLRAMKGDHTGSVVAGSEENAKEKSNRRRERGVVVSHAGTYLSSFIAVQII
jgi:UDP-N-acetylglucosamine transferase subunit ALG13